MNSCPNCQHDCDVPHSVEAQYTCENCGWEFTANEDYF